MMKLQMHNKKTLEMCIHYIGIVTVLAYITLYIEPDFTLNGFTHYTYESFQRT